MRQYCGRCLRYMSKDDAADARRWSTTCSASAIRPTGGKL